MERIKTIGTLIGTLSLLLHVVNASVRLPDPFSIEAGKEPKEKPTKQVIESFSVQTDIRYRFATTKMSSVIRNTAGIANEMAFDVTLPKEAFIVSFAMTIDGKVYDGEIKEKNAAKKQYMRAVEKGQSAGHIRQTPRHSNRFDVSVNVANGTAVNFTLVYQELLSRKLGLYDYEINVEPGQAVKDFNIEVFIQENRPLTVVRTPKLKKVSLTSNSIDAPIEITTVDRPSPTTAHIKYQPTVSQQGPRGLAAQFVVRYDVEHSDNGDILVADGYFLHLFAPKPLKALPKDIIFVLDVSGSMGGTKIDQLKVAMKTILKDVQEEDRFNILTFSNIVSKWKSHPTPASPDVIRRASYFVHRMDANGGTDINAALLSALLYDLYDLKPSESQSRVGMIFFLTDGQPTEGETDLNKIVANVADKNTDKSIYSLGFGDGADFELLKTISTQNFGFARKIYEASDAALQVSSLYEEISVVAMKNVSVEYLPGITKTTPTVFPIVHNGTEIMITGCIDLRQFRKPSLKAEEEMSERSFFAEIEGIESEGEVDVDLEIDDIDAVTISLNDDSLNTFFTMPRDFTGIIEKMWAFMTIKQMLKEKQGATENKTKVDELDKKILEMSLKYKFVTPLTSMVVTKPDTDSPVESSLEDADMTQSESMIHARPSVYKSSIKNRRQRMRAHSPNHKSYNQHQPLYSLTAGGRGVVVPGFSSIGSMDMSGLSKRMPRKFKKSKGKSRNNRKTKKVKFGVLASVVFRSNQTSMCLRPKKWMSGKYILIASANSDFKIELVTNCMKKCRIVIPTELLLTSGGRTSIMKLTSTNKWDYEQPLDFAVNFGKVNEMSFEHEDATIKISRKQLKRKMLYSLELFVKSKKSFSGIIDMLESKRTAKKAPKGCKSISADKYYVLAFKKAQRFLA